MKLVIISDSHGENFLIEEIVNIEGLNSTYIHLGDSESNNAILDRFIKVKGNCDYTYKLENKIDITLEQLKIHLEHGNNINFLLDKNKYIKECNCDIFLYGHSHKKEYLKLDNIHVFNPGSLNRPRDDIYGSYLILNIKNKNIENYEFKKINLKTGLITSYSKNL